MTLMKHSRKTPRLAAACLAVVVCGCGLLIAAGCAPLEPDPPPEEFQLDVLVYGRGRVLLDPGGGTYEDGTLVALLAIEEQNAFTLWGRDASGTDLITRVVVDRDKLVVALFEGDDAPSRTYDDPVIDAADGQFLGVINSRTLDQASIANPIGAYGNNSSDTSIWNPFTEYGSDFGNTSAFSSNAAAPPIVVSDFAFFSFLTTNLKFSPRLDPNDVARTVGREDEARD